MLAKAADSRGSASARPAVRLWAGSELGRRWRALVALGVIAGIAAGLALAAVAGARRTSTAYARFRAATGAPDAIVFATQLGIHDADYTPVQKLPEVVDSGTFNLAPIGIKEVPGSTTLAPGDAHLYRTLSRPLLRQGRLPDPTRDDELLVNRKAAQQLHLTVGRRVTLVSSPDISAFYGQSPMTGGPTVRATVVGVGDSAMDLVFGPGDPSFTPSGGFLARHAGQVAHAPNLVVRLRPGTNVARFHARAAAAMHLPDIPVRDLSEDRKRFTHGTDLERTGLLLFAASVALAGLVLVGQALARTVYAMADSSPALRALGLTRRDLMGGLVLPLGLTAGAAAIVAVATGVALSVRFPVGLARQLEPDLGVHADWLVLGLGALLLVLVVLGGAALAAFRAASARADRPTPAGAPAILRLVRRLAPLPVAIGATMALERGRGDRAVPVRPAIAGAVAGIVGIVGALGLVHGIDDALARPSRSGQAWDATVYPDDQHSLATLTTAMRGDKDVAHFADIRRAPLDVNGAGLPVYALKPLRGHVSFVVLGGRAPASPDEVALGPSSAKALHKKIGDQVKVGGARLRLVGTALLPQTPHSSFDQGAWVTPAVLRAQAGEPDPSQGPDEVLIATARAGMKPDALVSRLHARLGAEVDSTTQPQDVLLLRNVRSLPQALAAFLVLLGLAALGHALVTGVRRRRHDFAVLRAIGFRSGQNGACIAWQAMTVAAVGLVVGLPLGVAAGRLSWRWVADSTPLLYVAPLAVAAVVIAVPAAIVLANTLAALPARQAARLRPAEVLRTE